MQTPDVLDEALRRMGSGKPLGETPPVRIVGISNSAYRVHTASGDRVRGIPGAATASLLNRRAEKHNTEAMSWIGVISAAGVR